MEKHVKVGLPYVCSVCGRRFGVKKSVLQHLRTEHNLPFGTEYVIEDDVLERENIEKTIAECFHNEEIGEISSADGFSQSIHFADEVKVCFSIIGVFGSQEWGVDMDGPKKFAYLV